MPGYQPPVNLPARRLNLTELAAFGQAMVQTVGPASGTATLQRYSSHEIAIKWSDLEGLLPTDRQGVSLAAIGPVPPGPEGQPVIPSALFLSFGDGLAVPATLTAQGDAQRFLTSLQDRWCTFGQPRRTWELLYPLAFMLALAAALAPVVVLWATGQLSLWLIPLVLGVVWLAFAVGSPLLQQRVKQHRTSRAGLDIDFRLLDRVRLDRAVQRRNVRSGLWGGLAGAVATLIGVWITVAAQK